MSAQAVSRVVLVNAWHDDNVGDSAIALSCIQLAQDIWPSARIDVHTMLGRRDPAFETWDHHLRTATPDAHFHAAPLPEPRSSGRLRQASVVFRALQALIFSRAPWLLSSFWTFRREIRGAVAVIAIGGSDLFDNKRIRTGRLRLIRITAPLVIARTSGVPTHLWGHTLGPFETTQGQQIVLRALSGVRTIVVREEASEMLAREIAPGAEVIRAPDLAFVLQGDRANRRWPERYFALVPRRNFHDDSGDRTTRLVGELASFARGLLERSEVDRVVVVPQVTGPSELEDDRIVARQLVREIDLPGASLFEDEITPSGLVDLYAGAEAVVAVRLHGAILAMSSGTPAFAIAYFTGKTEGVMRAMGRETSWAEFDDVTRVMLDRWWRDLDRAAVRSELSGAAGSMCQEIASLVGRYRSDVP